MKKRMRPIGSKLGQTNQRRASDDCPGFFAATNKKHAGRWLLYWPAHNAPLSPYTGAQASAAQRMKGGEGEGGRRRRRRREEKEEKEEKEGGEGERGRRIGGVQSDFSSPRVAVLYCLAQCAIIVGSLFFAKIFPAAADQSFCTGCCRDCPGEGGRAFQFSKILSDFCSRGLNRLILYLKRPERSIRSKKKTVWTQRRSFYIVKMPKFPKNQDFIK